MVTYSRGRERGRGGIDGVRVIDFHILLAFDEKRRQNTRQTSWNMKQKGAALRHFILQASRQVGSHEVRSSVVTSSGQREAKRSYWVNVHTKEGKITENTVDEVGRKEWE